MKKKIKIEVTVDSDQFEEASNEEIESIIGGELRAIGYDDPQVTVRNEV